MDGLSSSLMLKALDCLSLRATVTASNIANASTAGYRPQRVDFEAMLQSAAQGGAGAVDQLKPKLSQPVDRLAGAGLRLDMELTTSSATALRYGALIDILNSNLQLEKLAIRGTLA